MDIKSRRERFFLYNSLSVLLKAVENERTTVDLRNEASIRGTIEYADAYMNIVMKDCVFIDPRGDCFNYDMFFVQARNIRFVHIPPKIRIIPAIKEQLNQLSGHGGQKENTKGTYKMKKIQQMQQESVMAMKKILDNRNKT